MQKFLIALFLILAIANCSNLKVRGFSRPKKSNDHMYEIPELTCAYRPHTTSTCAYSCVAPFLNCDNTISTKGCLINSNTDANNCGNCGTICAAAGSNSVSRGCVSGSCAYSCNAGYGNCDATPSDCETQLTTTTDCGSCGNACVAGDNAAVDACVSGECTYTCNAGFGNCDTTPEDCETPLTSNDNCGSCGTQCQLTNANSDCSSGSCLVQSCTGRFGNCNGNDADGCETNLDTSVNNCDTCGTVCPPTTDPNTQAACVSGQCSFSCTAGYGDCDVAPGCETDITTTTNCGTCGNLCTAGDNAVLNGCVSGSCSYSCNAGYGNCDATPSDCETQLTTTTDCGSCGNACVAGDNAAVDACVSGECTYTCDAGFGNCDATPEDCETQLTTTTNCGTCGNVCNLPNASEQCLAGVCAVLSCNAGYGNCNANQADGCEAHLLYDEQNCGVCGNVCGPNQHCKNGVCIQRHNYDDK